MEELTQAEKFMAVFPGLERAFGTYRYTGPVPPKGEKRKGRAVTINKPYTSADFERHLQGKVGIGIVPITDDSTCMWGAIDIDRYDLAPDAIEAILSRTKGSPLIPCKTKSGGIHYYVFFNSPVQAKTLSSRLRATASTLGFGGCEVFPKQSALITSESDVGNWINLPYFDADNTDRYAFDDSSKPLDLEGFFLLVEQKRTTLRSLAAVKFTDISSDDTEIVDGPPCLQTLVKIGFPKGSMNNGLLALGTYYKKAFPDKFAELIEQANQKWLGPGTAEEVSACIKSLKRKDYGYKCKEAPICNHCDRTTCLTRKYGVGGADLPAIANLQKHMTDPPTYFVDVNNVRIGPVAAADLLNQGAFRVHCMERANLVLPAVKTDRWAALLTSLMDKITEVDVPEEASAKGQLMQHLFSFVTGSAENDEKDKLLLGRVWFDGTHRYFRLIDFQEYLGRVRFYNFPVHQLCAILKQQGVKHKQLKISNRVVNVWVTEGAEPGPKVQLTEIEEDEPF